MTCAFLNEIQQFINSKICFVELSQVYSFWEEWISIWKRTSKVYYILYLFKIFCKWSLLYYKRIDLYVCKFCEFFKKCMIILVVNVKLLNPFLYNLMQIEKVKVLLILKCSHEAWKHYQIRLYCHLFIQRLAPLVVNWWCPCSVHRILTLYIFLIIKKVHIATILKLFKNRISGRIWSRNSSVKLFCDLCLFHGPSRLILQTI